MSDTSNVDDQHQPEGVSEEFSADDAKLWAELTGEAVGEADPTPGEGADPDAGTQQDSQDQQNTSDANDGDGQADGESDGGADGAQPSDADAGSDKAKAEDIWANAPPELRAAYEAERAAKAELDKRLRGQDQKIRQLTARQRSSTPEAKRNDAGKAAGSGTDEAAFNSDKFKRAKEDYPEIVEAFEDVLRAQGKQIGEVAETVQSYSTADQDRTFTENHYKVEERHPGYEDMASKPEFGAWLETQPQGIIDMAIRNGRNVADPAETILILDMYKAHIGSAEAGAPKAGSGGGQGANPSGKRQRQQESADVGPRTTSPRMTSSGEPGPNATEEEIWAFESKRADKDLRGAAA